MNDAETGFNPDYGVRNANAAALLAVYGFDWSWSWIGRYFVFTLIRHGREHADFPNKVE